MNSVAKAVVSGRSMPSMMDLVAGGCLAAASACSAASWAAAAAAAALLFADLSRHALRCPRRGRWWGCSWICNSSDKCSAQSHGYIHGLTID